MMNQCRAVHVKNYIRCCLSSVFAKIFGRKTKQSAAVGLLLLAGVSTSLAEATNYGRIARDAYKDSLELREYAEDIKRLRSLEREEKARELELSIRNNKAEHDKLQLKNAIGELIYNNNASPLANFYTKSSPNDPFREINNISDQGIVSFTTESGKQHTSDLKKLARMAGVDLIETVNGLHLVDPGEDKYRVGRDGTPIALNKHTIEGFTDEQGNPVKLERDMEIYGIYKDGTIKKLIPAP